MLERISGSVTGTTGSRPLKRPPKPLLRPPPPRTPHFGADLPSAIRGQPSMCNVGTIEFCLLLTTGAINQPTHSLIKVSVICQHSLVGMLTATRPLCKTANYIDMTAGKHKGHKHAHRHAGGSVDMIATELENRLRGTHKISPIELAGSMLHLVQSPFQASMQRTSACETCEAMLGIWCNVQDVDAP